MYALITESTVGSHVPPSGDFVLLSTNGTRGITFNSRSLSYSVPKNVMDFIRQQYRSGKIKGVLLGTDLDHTGTKIATVYRNFLDSEGIPNVRTAFTSKGYMKVGRCYSDSQMKMFALLDKLNIESAKFFREKFGLKKFSIQKATVVGSVRKWRGGTIKTRNGTNTFTALVKGLKKGLSAKTVESRLQSLYYAGSIEYPRVDVDYFTPETAYDVYAHPPLTSKGYTDDLISDFEELELPADKKTVILGIAEDRLITPATAFRYQQLIDEFFTDSLEPKPEYRKVVRECEALTEEIEYEYRSILSGISPRFPLSPAPPMPSRRKKKEEEEEILEWFKKTREKESLPLNNENGPELTLEQ